MLEITPWWANTFHFKNLFFFIPPSPLANENVKCFFSYHYVKFCHNEFNCHYDIKNWNYFNGLKNWVISILQSSNGKEMPVEFFSLKNNFFLSLWGQGDLFYKCKHTSKSKFVALSFSGLIQGDSGEYPLHVSFQPSFDKGALLSIVSTVKLV